MELSEMDQQQRQDFIKEHGFETYERIKKVEDENQQLRQQLQKKQDPFDGIESKADLKSVKAKTAFISEHGGKAYLDLPNN